MKSKKIFLIILSCLLCAGCIAGIIYAAARKPGKKETVSSGDNSEIKISAEIFAEISKVLLIKLQIVKKYRTNIRFVLYFFSPE